MFLDIILVPGDKMNTEKIKPDRNIVVIDVLRVCTTIVRALENGAEAIYPTLTVKEALEKKEELLSSGIPADTIILGGEREGVRLEGFDLGNSPLEYTQEVVKGKILVLSSTNGTKAARRSAGASNVVMGTIRNAGAVANFLTRVGLDTVFYLSGRLKEFSLEDAVGAGMMISLIGEARPSIELSDSAIACLDLYGKYQNDIVAMFRRSFHGRYLESLGFGEDLLFCARANESVILPRLSEDGFISDFRLE